MRRPILLSSILLALAGAGCGAAAGSEEDFEGEERRVAMVVEDLQDAAAKDEQRRICRQLLASDLAGRTTDCTATVKTALDESDSDELEVKSVRVEGERARAQVAFDEGLPRTVAWYRENTAWWEPIRSGDYRAYYERQYGKSLG